MRGRVVHADMGNSSGVAFGRHNVQSDARSGEVCAVRQHVPSSGAESATSDQLQVQQPEPSKEQKAGQMLDCGSLVTQQSVRNTTSVRPRGADRPAEQPDFVSARLLLLRGAQRVG